MILIEQKIKNTIFSGETPIFSLSSLDIFIIRWYPFLQARVTLLKRGDTFVY